MLSPQQFAAAWGGDRYLFSADQLRDISLPETSKAFLLEAGLPLWAEVPLGFYVVPLPVFLTSPPMQAAKYPLLARYESTGFRLLGDLHYDNHLSDAEAGLYYAVQEDTGHVYRMEPDYVVEEGTSHVYQEHSKVRGKPSRFLNTSLPQFVEFLLDYRDFVAHFWPTEPERSEVPILVESLEQKWWKVDPLAMASSDNCWPMDTKDMKIQL